MQEKSDFPRTSISTKNNLAVLKRAATSAVYLAEWYSGRRSRMPCRGAGRASALPETCAQTESCLVLKKIGRPARSIVFSLKPSANQVVNELHH